MGLVFEAMLSETVLGPSQRLRRQSEAQTETLKPIGDSKEARGRQKRTPPPPQGDLLENLGGQIQEDPKVDSPSPNTGLRARQFGGFGKITVLNGSKFGKRENMTPT